VQKSALGLAFVLTLPMFAWAQAHTSAVPSNDEIRAILADRIDVRRQGVGIVVGVVDSHGSRIVGYGNLDRRDARPVTGDTLFEIGSLTKVFTALLLTEMVQHGEVALTDPVARYLPQRVQVPERGGRSITLEDLATHTSGLPRTPANIAPKDPTNPFADYSAEQLYDFLSTYQLPRDIGSEWEYSNLGSGLLGHALALRAGTDYETLVRSRITVPLEMESTRITLRPEDRQRLAVGHESKLTAVPNSDFQVLAGAGALRSSANDMLKFIAAVVGYNKSPLAPAMAALLDVRRPTSIPGLMNALGWQVSRPDALEIVWKDGNTLGYSSFLGYNPRSRIGVVVLSNTGTTTGINSIGMHVLDAASPLFQQTRRGKEPNVLTGAQIK
jgi:serine-type D-Ala-D-Ala carboxypeptidase/endopeptidase